MEQSRYDRYGNPTYIEEGVPLWAEMAQHVPVSAESEALIVAEEPGRWMNLARYDSAGEPAAILRAWPLVGGGCCGRRQVEHLVAMTRADQRRRGLMRQLYRELDRRGYCALHPFSGDRTADGVALAAALAEELDPSGERRGMRRS